MSGLPLIRLIVGFALHASFISQSIAAEQPGSQHGVFGTIEGMIRFEGEASKSSIPDDAGVSRDVLEVDRKTGGLRYVVVYLDRTNRSVLPSSALKSSTEKSVMDQQNHEFTPRIIAVRQGQAVVFSNSDPANHNVRTTASVKTNQFNVFTGIDGKYEHRFVVEPEYRPIRLGCDIHPWMRGWVFVFDHPHFAVTDEAGKFRIASVPPGEYQLHILQPDIRYRTQQNIVVKAGESLSVERVVRHDGKRDP